MDAYDVSEKIKKYWAVLYPKNSGEMLKPRSKVKVVVYTDEGWREVVGVYINDNVIELKLDTE